MLNPRIQVGVCQVGVCQVGVCHVGFCQVGVYQLRSVKLGFESVIAPPFIILAPEMKSVPSELPSLRTRHTGHRPRSPYKL